MKKFLKKLIPNREDGNAFLMYIFIFPIMCGAVGLSLDTGLGTYTQNGIQNAVDNAVVAGAAQTKYSGKKKVIDFTQANKKVNEIYNEQRKDYPNITGETPSITVKLIKGRGTTADTLSVVVKEKSPTIFLHLVGVNEFNYDVRGQARLGYLQD